MLQQSIFILTMNIQNKIQSLAKLGVFLQNNNNNEIKDVINLANIKNKWFTPKNIEFCFEYWSKNLNCQNLISWINNYQLNESKPKRIGLVLAGNIPLVGLHDIICVLISGNIAQIKTSSKDDVLIPYLIKKLIEIDPSFEDQIEFVETLKDYDAVIATGSNNTARYFEHYFRKVPNIIRKNRTSVAILDGNESAEQLLALGDDIFRYFGQGCRNISKIYLPEDYSVQFFFESIDELGDDVMNHNKYKNNLDYNLSILLLDRAKHFTNNFLILQEHTDLYSPTAIVYYEYYNSGEDLKKKLKQNEGKIQCIVSDNVVIENSIPIGTSQKPQLNQYADMVDSIEFLNNL